MAFFIFFMGREREIGGGGLFNQPYPDEATYSALRMNYYSEHMSTEQMFSNSLFDGVKSPIHAEPVHFWIGTDGGVSRYDGRIWQTLTQEDGLPSNAVWSIFPDRDGSIWIGTTKGVVRYRPSTSFPPPIFIDSVIANERFDDVSELAIPYSTGLTSFQFHSMSFKTRSAGMVYHYRLKGWDAHWNNTHQRCTEYQALPVGDYAFEVMAVDRDLNYSEQVAVQISVVPDPHMEALNQVLNQNGIAGEFIGTSEALHRIQSQLAEVAPTELTVLILGETGTGKGLAARAVHDLSKRSAGPFIQVNCGAIPEGLVESELFGHERGAFTGAITRQLGKVELAKGGTLFLDEIGDLPLAAQVKLLRFLDEHTFERVGGADTFEANVRVIAATNRDFKKMVVAGQFREDLFFRLQTFPVRLPPLRERREDIPLLAAYFIERMATHLDRAIIPLNPDAGAALQAYEWPGNVRELEHAVQRALIVCREATIGAADIILDLGLTGTESVVEIVSLAEHERRYICKILEQTGWSIKGAYGAAALLGVPESTLRSRMKKLAIRRLS